MISYLMIFHAVISVLLILTVLLQFGKGAEAGFLSGGASEAVLSGAQKGNILTKITTVLAILFLGNSILLAKLESTKSSKSALDSMVPTTTQAAPVIPAPKADKIPAAPAKK